MFGISQTHNHKATAVSLGDIDLFFSYETLIGFAVPGVGRVTSENRWSSTTGKHLNAIYAKYAKIDRESFVKCQEELDKFFGGKGTRKGLESRLTRILSKVEVSA